MTGNAPRQLHGYLATLRELRAASPQDAWRQVLQIEEAGELIVAMRQVAELLDDTVRSIRAADGQIDVSRKLAYLPEWTNPVYGWDWPGNPQDGNHLDSLHNYPRQAAVDVLEGVADTLERFGYDQGLSAAERESLLDELVKLRDEAFARVSDPTVRYFLVNRLQLLIDGLTAPGVRGSDIFAGSAAATASEFQRLYEDPRIGESDRRWIARAYDGVLRAAHLAGIGATIYLGIRHDPASAAITLAAAKDAISRIADRASLQRLDRAPIEIEMKSPPDESVDGSEPAQAS